MAAFCLRENQNACTLGTEVRVTGDLQTYKETEKAGQKLSMIWSPRSCQAALSGGEQWPQTAVGSQEVILKSCEAVTPDGYIPQRTR